VGEPGCFEPIEWLQERPTKRARSACLAVRILSFRGLKVLRLMLNRVTRSGYRPIAGEIGSLGELLVEGGPSES
jgi:hypothetical protein